MRGWAERLHEACQLQPVAPGWTAALRAAACGSTHMKKQWAAVRTHWASMMVPPQMWIGPYCTLTCQGHLLTEVSFPPMIRPEILCPQAGGESSAERRARRGGKPGGGWAQHPHYPQAPAVLGSS